MSDASYKKQMKMTKNVIVQNWGHIEFKQAWQKQKEIQALLINRKRAQESKPNFFVFCEHPHIYTIGKTGSMDNLLLNHAELENIEAKSLKINRGGDITYHGPGQIVGYPILDLDEFFTDIHKYIRYIEETIIRTLGDFDIEGFRIDGYTGVWTGNSEKLEKICAIGVHLSRWVTMHGFALNVNTDLNYFDHIIPCGINEANKSVTSISKLIGRPIPMRKVQGRIIHHFTSLFEAKIIERFDF